MQKVIKENLSKYLSIFLILQPVLDMLTGICLHIFHLNITLGIIIRLLFLAFIGYIIIFIYKKKKPLIYYIIFLIYMCFYCLGIYLYKDGIGLFTELQGLLRVFYFPLLLLSLYEIKDEFKISKLTLFTTLSLYLLFIFIPVLFHVGFKSYEITKSGTLGFFNSANEISGIISILTPIIFIIFTTKKNPIINTIYTLTYLFVILTIGTKTPLLSLFITVGMTIIWLIIKSFKEKKYKMLLSSFLIIVISIIGLVIVIPKTNFYKNIMVHLDYLHIKDISDITENKEVIDHFIFSERITFFGAEKSRYLSTSSYEKLFGDGYLQDGKRVKDIEIDYYDIYFHHGIIGFLIFFIPYLYVLFKVATEQKKKNYNNYMLNVSLLLAIVLSFFTGHIITSPAVSIFVIMIILELSNSKKKRLLFAIKDLEIGGIETAIINLLNNMNYEKYDVTLIMEERKGTLLKNVNENVHIQELKVSNISNVIIRKSINMLRKLNYEILNYHNYDFSCCYTTYSLSSNKIARVASKNNSFYVHSNYKYIYEMSEFKKFFEERHINDFKKIFFVANEAKNDFLKVYPNLKNKCMVFNNFVSPNMIIEKSKEKIDYKKPKNKTLFVFVGRLDDSAKKLSRAILLIKELENCELLIVGDGPDREMYEKLTKENKLTSKVTFVGKKANPYPYMVLADYIILTSDYEGFPVTYLEAITLHKRLITTIDVSDELINIGKDYATIISKEQKILVKDVKKELKNPREIKKIDINDIQEKRLKELEKIFDEVI